MRSKIAGIMLLLLNAITMAKAIDWTVDVTVSKDGSGDFNNITEAINANPNDGSNYVIFIKKGTYNEKLFITEDNITLLGEDRDETIITQSILRRIWLESNSSDWGVATINIQNGVSGLTLANLTVRNNFADLNPEVENNNEHTMAIRGGGDKIIIVNCNILATGGDTLSLWNTDGGRFYHSGCFFEGYVDYVCPRGYCYISNSDFFGHNKSASIWHDGSGGEDHKLVVKNSYFDGIEDFALGRFHRMAAFYLLDCYFSETMKDNGGILYVGDSSTQDRDKLVYGTRTYYDRCNRETGNYSWFGDNLSNAKGSPDRNTITEKWTFGNTWNPELEIQGLLRRAFLPQPACYAKKVESTPTLSWLPGKDAVEHLIYFGNTANVDLIAKTSDSLYTITEGLKGATRYFWKVDEITSGEDTVPGKLWTFTTNVTSKPESVVYLQPPIDTNWPRLNLKFEWLSNEMEVDTFFFYLGTHQDSLVLVRKQTNVGYNISGLESNTTYYWRVDAQNELGITEGPLWFFHFKKEASSLITEPDSKKGIIIYPNPVSNSFTIDYYTMQQENFTIAIYDLSGKVIYQSKQIIAMQGRNIFNYRLKDILNGKIDTGQLVIKIMLPKNTVSKPLIIK